MKTLFFIGCTLSLSFASTLTSAQTADSSLKTIYEQQTIYFEGNTIKYVKNNQKKKTGLFGKKLNHEFENSSTEAKQEMGIYEKHSKRATLFLTTGAVIIVTAIVLIPEIAFPVYAGLTVAGIIPYTIGVIHSFKAPPHLYKAVWLHNRDIVIKK